MTTPELPDGYVLVKKQAAGAPAGMGEYFVIRRPDGSIIRHHYNDRPKCFSVRNAAIREAKRDSK